LKTLTASRKEQIFGKTAGFWKDHTGIKEHDDDSKYVILILILCSRKGGKKDVR
jgi:hypothetical protein